jgi:hypothetical protein
MEYMPFDAVISNSSFCVHTFVPDRVRSLMSDSTEAREAKNLFIKAFLVGTHPRVGQESGIRYLPRDVLRLIYAEYMNAVLCKYYCVFDISTHLTINFTCSLMFSIAAVPPWIIFTECKQVVRPENAIITGPRF